MTKKTATTSNSILSKIQELAAARSAAKMKLREANSEKLKAAKDALHELEETIKSSNGCDNLSDAQRYLTSIQDQYASRTHVINETQKAYRSAKSSFDEADAAFFEAIEDSKQGDLFEVA